MNILHNSRNIFVAGCGYQTPISHRAAWRPGGRGELVPAISCCYHQRPACEVTTTGPSIPPPLTTSVVTAVVSTGQHSHHHLQLSHAFLEGSLTVLVVSCFGFCFVNIHVSLSQGVREKAQVFETLIFFGKGLTQIETDVQLL